MEQCTLGRTGRTVSRIGFGGAPAGIPNYLRPFDPAQPDERAPIIAAIQRAVELGITYYDVAPGYGEGVAERLFGEALEPTPSDRLFLATKVGIWQETEVRASLESSLANLRRDYVDLLQIHGTCYTPEHAERILRPGGYLDQMERLRDEGLIRHLGFSVECINRPFYQLLDSDRFEVVQVLANVVTQHAYDPVWQGGILYDLEQKGLGIAAMRSTTSGLLQRWIQRVHPANTFDYTPATIQFQFSNPLIDVVLLGMRSISNVEANVALCADLSGRIDIPALYQRRA